MTRPKTLTDIELALELYQLNERIKADTHRADEIKNYFKGSLPDGSLNLGPFEIFIESATRSSLDRKNLELEFGPERLERFYKTTSYRTIRLIKNGKVA